MNVDFFSVGKSVVFLQKKCKRVLKIELGINLQTISETNFEWPVSDESKIHDVLLLGDALLLLTNSYLWPKIGKFRFWVLSEAHKHLIIEMVGIDKKHISVIPRDLIFRRKKSTQSLPDFTTPSTFVMSSRIDDDKNISFTLHFANALQNFFPTLRIVIFSPTRKKSGLKESIDRFDWKSKPRVLGDRGFNWHKTVKLVKPFLVNLSTYPMEDFSVSTAQAQEVGWPLILSNWAVFREIHGPSVLKINAKDIFLYKKTDFKREQDRIIQKVLKNVLARSNKNWIQNEIVHQLKVPIGISGTKLMNLQEAWTPERRKKLIQANMEPRRRTNNQEYKRIRTLLS